jgi:hypothetical protein
MHAVDAEADWFGFRSRLQVDLDVDVDLDDYRHILLSIRTTAQQRPVSLGSRRSRSAHRELPHIPSPSSGQSRSDDDNDAYPLGSF